MSKVVRSRLTRRVRKNPVAADGDFLADAPGAEDVEITNCLSATSLGCHDTLLALLTPTVEFICMYRSKT